jgi:hypothetical protein
MLNNSKTTASRKTNKIPLESPLNLPLKMQKIVEFVTLPEF